MSSLQHRREMPRRRAGGMMMGWKIFFQGAAVGFLILPICLSALRQEWWALVIEIALCLVAFWYGGKNAEKVL